MKILLLCKAESFAMNVLRCLAELKAECHVFGHGRSWAVSLSKYCREYTGCDFSGSEDPGDDLIQSINGYCERRKIDFILPSDYDTTMLLAKIKDRIRGAVKVFPVAEPETLKMMDDKWEFANLLEKNGFPYPKTYLVESYEQLARIDLPFPRIVKPFKTRRTWTGGIGASYVKKTLRDYFAIGRKDRYPLLVQEFIPGTEINLSILAHEGRIVSWTTQKWVRNDTIQFTVSEEILELGRRIVAAARYEGVAHFDFRVDARDGSIKCIECNPWFWGSLRASMRNGVNFVSDGLLVSQGKSVVSMPLSRDIEYLLPSTLLAQLLKGRFSTLKNIPKATRQDLMQIIIDPLSCFFSIIRRN